MNYYDILEISPKASDEVIRMAYKALVKKYHPDVFHGDKIFAEKKMKEINEAYEVLSDSSKRRLYDFKINNKQSNSNSESKTSSNSTASYNSYNQSAAKTNPNNYKQQANDENKSNTASSNNSATNNTSDEPSKTSYDTTKNTKNNYSWAWGALGFIVLLLVISIINNSYGYKYSNTISSNEVVNTQSSSNVDVQATSSITTMQQPKNTNTASIKSEGAVKNISSISIVSSTTNNSASIVNPTFTKISKTFSLHSMAIMSDGSLWAWGSNSDGQIGDGDTNYSMLVKYVKIPKQIFPSGVTAIAGGNKHSLALKTDGSVWTWGSNESGQLGDGTQWSRNWNPKQVIANSVVEIAAGYHHSLAIKTDGSLWAWGSNGYGQFGDGNNGIGLIPKQVISSGIKSVAAGAYHTLILKTDGSLWSCGGNNSGQLGDGTSTDSNIPKKIISSGIIAIAAGGYHSLAVKSDGSLWVWGSNARGKLGDGTETNSLLPKQIIANGVKNIVAGYDHTLILKIDGSVWACGDNEYGQLGDGTSGMFNYSSTLKQIISNGVIDIAAGAYHSLAIKSDGSFWAWGSNGNYQFGDGTELDSLVPKKIN